MDVFNQAQHFCPGSAFIEMDDFARSRLHWNINESYDELCDEFRRAYYKDAEPFVTEYLHAIENYYRTLEGRGWNVRYNNKAAIRKYLYKLEEIYAFKEILDRALAAAQNISDKEASEKVYARVDQLTLFYKLVLVICFPLEIPKEEALSIIDDLRILTQKIGFTNFHKRLPIKDFLDEAEDIVLGKISEADRKIQLKQPNEK
jgi:hypothetical protein